MRKGACEIQIRYLKVATISSCFAAFLSFGEAAATPADMTVERLLTICEAPTVQEAIVSGDELDWKRLTDADIDEWRRSCRRLPGCVIGSAWGARQSRQE